MTNVLRFHAPVPWLTRDLKECVLASDYDCMEAAWLDACERGDKAVAENAALRQRLRDWHRVADERSAEIVRLSARLAEETAIVDRIWDIYGRPTYEQLAGRSIYDLINADRKRLAELEAEHAAFSNNVEQCEAENDRLRSRLATALELLRKHGIHVDEKWCWCEPRIESHREGGE